MRAIFIPDDYRLPALLGRRVSVTPAESAHDPSLTVRWMFPTDDPSIVTKALSGSGLFVPLDRPSREDDTSPGKVRR